MATADRSPPALAALLARASRTITLGVAAALLVTLALAWAVLVRTHPEIERLTELTQELRLSHEAMLDRDTALRSWLVTGQDVHLGTVERIDERAAARAPLVVDLASGDAAMTALVVDLRVAQTSWLSSWAATAAEGGITDAELPRFLSDGRDSFTSYRRAYDAAVERASSARDAAVDLERTVLVAGIMADALICGGLLVVSRRQRKEIDRSVTGPLDDLVATMQRIGAGDLTARPKVQGPSELQLLATGLSEMTSALAHQQTAATRRAADAESSGDRLREILDLARDIAGSLSLRYVAESVALAAARVTGAERAVVWLRDLEADDLTAVHDSSVAHGDRAEQSPIALGAGTVGTAARDARAARTTEQDRMVLAVPMVVGARVVGVLELVSAPGGQIGLGEALEALAIHAGAALEAARLHQHTDELSRIDALTRLANRRKLEADLADELERAHRYGRPLSLVMADIDHFKALNDTWGHQVGDEVLQQVAAQLAEGMRTSDTVYRYGGEEFMVLVRDSGPEDAAQLAERLRSHVAELIGPGGAAGKITMSFGVAALNQRTRSRDQLIGDADRALYHAKASGRNQVVVAPDAPDQAAEDAGTRAAVEVEAGTSAR